MPLPPEYQQLLQSRREAEERDARSATRRDLLLTLVKLLASVLAGMGVIGFALHTSDEGWGWIWWWSGWFIWVGGVWLTLLRAYNRGVARGDWT